MDLGGDMNQGEEGSTGGSPKALYAPGKSGLIFFMLGLIWLVSLTLLVLAEQGWRTEIQVNEPLKDNLMQVRVSLSKGQWLLERIVTGDKSIREEDILPFFRQAELFVGDSIKGKSNITNMVGITTQDRGTLERLRRLQTLIGQHRKSAVEVLERFKQDRTRDMHDIRLSFYVLEDMADLIDYDVNEKFGEMMVRQQERHLSAVALSILLFAGVSVVLFVYYRKTEKAEHALRESYADMESQVEERTAELKAANELLQAEITERKQVEEALQKHSHDLGERAKEQRCLYAISEAAGRADISQEETLHLIADLIPPGWHYPEITCARISWKGREYLSRGFLETKWRLASDLSVGDDQVGTVEVNYLEEKPKLAEGPFLAEERNLIDAIAGILGRFMERKQAEIALHEAKEEAETANRAKSEFLSRMSHELRTPLHGVLGFAQILDMDTDPALSDRQRTATKHILNSGEHLLALIDDVLDLARIDGGKLVLSIETVAPTAVLSECLEMIRGLAGSHGIALEDRVSGKSLPPIRADMTRFHQVLINLLSNAIKYNHEGGCVSLDCEATAEGMLRISVADTGSGIPVDMQHKLFDPFQRLGKETSEIEGTGIGLTVAKELMEMMNGSIGFESTVGKGSTFWVDFPLAGEAELEEEGTVRGFAADDDAIETPREPVLAGGSDGHTVLYVEDNPHNLRLMEAIIGETPGIHLISAGSAELGVKMAEKDAPDLILMDINLPGMSGTEAVHLLKANAKTRDIPVIAVTAAAMSHDVGKGKKDGFSGYLVKPFKVYDLLKTIAETLEGRY